MAKAKKKVAVISTKRRKVVLDDSKEEAIVLKKIARVSINARRRAFSNKATVTVIRDGRILTISASRKQKVIGTVAQRRVDSKLAGKQLKIK